MKSNSKDTKQHILDTGYQLIVSKGFSSVGLSALLKAAEVPKGSFYHYFKSKEEFGEALIQDYFNEYHSSLEALFTQSNLSGLDRLMAYWQRWIDTQSDTCCEKRCLVVKLTAEVADLSEPMRFALKEGTTKVTQLIAHCIRSGIQDGSIIEQDADKTAKFLYQMWLGASLLNKLHRDPQGLDPASKITVSLLTQKAIV